jgi:uncharacterized Zn finger protein
VNFFDSKALAAACLICAFVVVRRSLAPNGQAEREVAKLKKRKHSIAPVKIEGRTIARSFWGQAWCANLERYSDYENRLPRGRSYVRNGCVVDLQIARGEVTAMVAGSDLYRALRAMDFKRNLVEMDRRARQGIWDRATISR